MVDEWGETVIKAGHRGLAGERSMDRWKFDTGEGGGTTREEESGESGDEEKRERNEPREQRRKGLAIHPLLLVLLLLVSCVLVGLDWNRRARP